MITLSDIWNTFKSKPLLSLAYIGLGACIGQGMIACLDYFAR